MDDQTKREFWKSSGDIIKGIIISEKFIIGGDLNSQVGETYYKYKGVHGGFGYDERNEDDYMILNFMILYDFIIVNTHLKRRDEHIIIKFVITIVK